MHDGDVVDVEKMTRDADRSLRAAGCAATGNDDRKDRRVRTDFLFSVFADEFEDLSRVDLAGERLGDGRRNASGHTRVEAMNDNRLEIGNDLAELRPSLPFVKIPLAADNCLVISFDGSGHVCSLVEAFARLRKEALR